MILIVLSMVLSIIAPMHFIDYAVNAAEATIDVSEAAMKKLEDQMKKLQQDQKENDAKLKQAQENYVNSTQQKKYLDEQIKLKSEEIELQNKYIIEIKNEINRLKGEIDDTSVFIEEQYDIFLQLMKHAYEEGTASYLEIILGATSLPEFIMNIERAGQILSYQQTIMNELEQHSQVLSVNVERMQTEETKLKDEETKLLANKNDLEKQQKEAANAITESNYQIVYTQAEQEEINKLFDEIDAKVQQILEERKRLEVLKAKESQRAYTAGVLLWPTLLSNNKISSNFGYRDFDNAIHKAIDIPVKYGDDIYACADGEVVTSTYHNSYGNYVLIDHGLDSNGNSIATLYAHNQKNVVSTGDIVQAGDKIAEGGSSGFSTGAHCHLEVRINGVAVNPLTYVSQP